MPVYLSLANFIISKNAIIKKYKGGLEQFRIDAAFAEADRNQEDNELFNYVSMNIGSQKFDDLQALILANGLDFDKENQFSDDFTLKGRYTNWYWEPTWLKTNNVFTWHQDANPESIAKAIAIGRTRISEIDAMFERGERPFDAIW